MKQNPSHPPQERFIGHSQNRMNSLQRRVNGLEKVLDKMSHDLAISTRRISSADAVGYTCCMLPGAELFESKNSGGKLKDSSSVKVSIPIRCQSIKCTPNKDVNTEDQSQKAREVGIKLGACPLWIQQKVLQLVPRELWDCTQQLKG